VTKSQTFSDDIIKWASAPGSGLVLALRASGESAVYKLSGKLGDRLVAAFTLPTSAASDAVAVTRVVECISSSSGCLVDYFAVAESKSSSTIYVWNRAENTLKQVPVPVPAAAVQMNLAANNHLYTLFASSDTSNTSVLCTEKSAGGEVVFAQIDMPGVTSMTTIPLTTEDTNSLWHVAVAAAQGKSRIMRLSKSSEAFSATGDAYAGIAGFHAVPVGDANWLLLETVNGDILQGHVEGGRIRGPKGGPLKKMFASNTAHPAVVSSFTYTLTGKSKAQNFVVFSGAGEVGAPQSLEVHVVSTDGFTPFPDFPSSVAAEVSQRIHPFVSGDGGPRLLSSGAGINSHMFRLSTINKEVDCTPSEGWAVFADDETEQNVVVSVINDDIPELDEIASVILEEASGEASRIIVPSSVAVILSANDEYQGVVGFHPESLSVAPFSEPENNHVNVTLRLLRRRGLDGPVHVPWAIAGGESAVKDIQGIDGKHYGIATFGNQERFAELHLVIRTDDDPELAEIFQVVLSAPESGTTAGLDGGRDSAFVTILGNDDIHGRFGFANVALNTEEGNDVKLSIVRTTGFEGSVDVTYRTVSGSADGVDDFESVETTVRFNDSQTVFSVQVGVVDDEDPEEDERFMVEIVKAILVNASSFLVENSTLSLLENSTKVEVTIAANDGAFGSFGFAATAMDADEPVSNPQNLSLTVVRSRGNAGRVVLGWTAAGTEDFAEAEFGKDIISKQQGFLTFEDGVVELTIDIVLLPDDEPELVEVMAFTLSAPVLNNSTTTVGSELPTLDKSKETSIVKFKENDDARGVFSLDLMDVNPPVEEGETVDLVIKRAAGAFGNVVVAINIQADGESGWTAQDVMLPRSTVVFADGDNEPKTVQLSIRDDVEPEGEEGFSVVLSIVSGEARVSEQEGEAKASFVIQTNDNGNGVFGFSKDSRQVFHVEEVDQSVVDLVVDRTEGLFGEIVLDWEVDVGSLCNAEPSSTKCAGKAHRQDFSGPIKGRLVFGENVASQSLQLVISSDTQPEDNEVFRVVLSVVTTNFVGALVGDTAEITLLFNDDGRGVLGFDGSLFKVVDEGEEVKLNVKRSIAQFGQVSASWAVVDPATGRLADSDFVQVTGTLTFLENSTDMEVISLDVIESSNPELPENYNVVITAATGGASIREGFGVYAIQIRGNQDPFGVVTVLPKITLAYRDFPFETERSISFTGSRSGGSFGQVEVDYQVGYSSTFDQLGPVNRGSISKLESNSTFRFAAGAKRVEHSVPLPSEMILVDGDTITVTVLKATLLSGVDGELNAASPRLGAADAVDAGVVITVVNADNMVGFLSSTPTTLSEGSQKNMIVSRRSVRGALTCDIAVLGPDGKSSSDASLSMTRISIPEGSDSVRIKIEVPRDNIPELDEEVVVRLSNIQVTGSSSAELEGALERVFTIVANEKPHGLFSFAAESFTLASLPVPESGQTVQLPIDRLGGHEGRVTVTFSVSGASTDDYTVLNTKSMSDDNAYSVDFAHGQKQANIEVVIVDDDLPELKELISIELTAVRLNQEEEPGDPPALSTSNILEIKIDESDSPYGVLAFRETTIVVDEDSNGGEAVYAEVTVERMFGKNGRVSGRLITDPSDGKIGGDTEDYTTFAENVEFGPNEDTPVTVRFKIQDDSIPEEDEQFRILLTDPKGGVEIDASSAVATVTLLANDDPNGVLGFEDLSPAVVEADGELTLIVKRTRGTFGAVAAEWKAIKRVGSSFTIDDLEGHRGSIVIAAGESEASIQLKIVNNDNDEVDETFDLVLHSPSGGARIDTDSSTSTVKILYHGDPHGIFAFDCESKYGGNNANGQQVDAVPLRITRAGTIGRVSVSVHTVAAASTGTAGIHYDAIVGQVVTFEDGETIKAVTLNTKKLVGANSSKVVTIRLQDPTGGAVINSKQARAQVTIYATSFTASLVASIRDAACKAEQVFSSGAQAGRQYNQIEYDQIIYGISDLLISADEIVQSSRRRSRIRRADAAIPLLDKIKVLLSDLLNADHIDVDGNQPVTEFRNIVSLLHHYGELRVATRTESKSVSYCPGRMRELQTPQAVMLVSTDTAAVVGAEIFTPTSGPGLGDRDVDDALGQVGVRHSIALPTQAEDCVPILHSDFRSALWFPVVDGFGGVGSSVVDTALTEMLVMQSKVVTVKRSGGRSWLGPVRYAIPFATNDKTVENYKPTAHRVCVWWDSAVGSSGQWSSTGCRELDAISDGSKLLAVDDGEPDEAVTCECNQANATTFGVLVPAIQPTEAARMGSLFTIVTFIKAACLAFVLAQLWMEGSSNHLRLTTHFVGALFANAVLNVVSSILATEVSVGACQIIGALLHYSMMVPYTWGIAVALHLYLGGVRQTKTFEVAKPYAGMLYRLVFLGWGVPAATILITLVFNSSTDMGRLYGHTMDDNRLCLAPQARAGVIYATVGIAAALCAVLALVIQRSVSGLDATRRPWLKHSDLFELGAIFRQNGHELKVLLVGFLLIVVDTFLVILAAYQKSQSDGAIAMIVGTIMAVYFLVYYGAYGVFRHILEENTHALPAKDLRVETLTVNRAFDVSEVSGAAGSMVGPISPGGRARSASGGGGDRDSWSYPASPLPDMSETKGHGGASVVVIDDEEDFDELVYALRTDVFSGGEDSQSIASIGAELDPQSRGFAVARMSIMDTHL
jgi:hypothetical protein